MAGVRKMWFFVFYAMIDNCNFDPVAPYWCNVRPRKTKGRPDEIRSKSREGRMGVLISLPGGGGGLVVYIQIGSRTIDCRFL